MFTVEVVNMNITERELNNLQNKINKAKNHLYGENPNVKLAIDFLISAYGEIERIRVKNGKIRLNGKIKKF